MDGRSKPEDGGEEIRRGNMLVEHFGGTFWWNFLVEYIGEEDHMSFLQ